jgi:hypothetical protein
MTCAELARTTQVAGQAIVVKKYQTAGASSGAPQYCAVTGEINTYIGFEILLPISNWRQRYLQGGCGGLCGSININPPQTTAYKPPADHDGTQFHLARVHLRHELRLDREDDPGPAGSQHRAERGDESVLSEGRAHA